MKYWKQFWGGLNQGWKRIHYVILFFPAIIFSGLGLLLLIGGTNRGQDAGGLMIFFALSILAFYYLLITAIYWIKEGFQSKDEPTKEDE